jgi:hypothetical protein
VHVPSSRTRILKLEKGKRGYIPITITECGLGNLGYNPITVTEYGLGNRGYNPMTDTEYGLGNPGYNPITDMEYGPGNRGYNPMTVTEYGLGNRGYIPITITECGQGNRGYNPITITDYGLGNRGNNTITVTEYGLGIRAQFLPKLHWKHNTESVAITGITIDIGNLIRKSHIESCVPNYEQNRKVCDALPFLFIFAERGTGFRGLMTLSNRESAAAFRRKVDSPPRGH